MNLLRQRERGEERRPLTRLQQEINRLFESPLEAWARGSELFSGWGPAVDLYEEEDSITVNAEMPGLQREDIDVSVHGNTLNISGERKQEKESGKGESYRSERRFGRFQRCVQLPCAVDAAKVTATYTDGILRIELPKTGESRRRRIEVKGS